jgi:long-chain fatty acid transport protein
MKSTRRGVVGAGAVGLAILAWSHGAEAAGFANTRIGGEQGTPVDTNPTALFWNPGALGFSGGGALALYGTLSLRSQTWNRQPSPSDATSPNGQVGNLGQAHLFNVFGGPALGGSIRLGNLVLGLGFFAPYFARVHWDKNNSLSGQTCPTQANPMEPCSTTSLPYDGVQRWYQIDTELSILYFSPGAAYRLGPLSIGAAANIIYSKVVTTRSQNIFGMGFPDSNLESRTALDVSSVDGSFAAGAMLEAVPQQLWIGVSYQAQPAMGQQKLSGTLDITNLDGSHQPLAKVSLYQNLPDIYRAGVRWRMKSAPLEFRLFGDFTRWSVMTTQCVAVDPNPCQVVANGAASGSVAVNLIRNWNDTYGGRLGVSYWADPDIELLFGAGAESAAVPDATMTPEISDAFNLNGTFGARFKLTRSLFLTASYTHQQFLNRDNTGKSTLTINNGAPVRFPTVQYDGGGKYTQWIGYAVGNLEALFP